MQIKFQISHVCFMFLILICIKMENEQLKD